MRSPLNSSQEWLEADGLGGFASGTATGIRTRRYHALLLVAVTPPTGRVVLVNGLDAWVETPKGTFPLSSQHYAPDVVHPDGATRIEAFEARPWPQWIFKLPDGTRVEQELYSCKGEPLTCVRWKVLGPRKDLKLRVRVFLSGRDYHGLHKANGAFRFAADIRADRVLWTPYDGVPGVAAVSNGRYTQEPLWFYNFLYTEEQARGLDCQEDLASPGVFEWNLGQEDAVLVFTTAEHADASFPALVQPTDVVETRRKAERKRRDRFGSQLEAAADAYLVQGQRGKTIVAGYPWFTDWGRDTFVAMRGLCLATGRLADAREILLSWAEVVSEGMLPNRFPDSGQVPEYNSVDASLWYVIAVYEYLRAAKVGSSRCDDRTTQRAVPTRDRSKLVAAVHAILEGYSHGTRYGIQAESDGLLSCGERGTQLTWMDARVGDWVVTPRVGKPVEVQALWLNALWIGSQLLEGWDGALERGLEAFQRRFWNPRHQCLFDSVDVDHQAGAVDETIRPNQIFAVGGLPLNLLDSERARLVVDSVERELLTPMGLRSLAPNAPGYVPHYVSGVKERDGSYHQGTVWPWLIGPFIEAWVRVRGESNAAKRQARARFLDPFLQHLESAGLGHISEIADGDPPHTPRGCPFQAWSVAEALRLDRVVLAETSKIETYEKQRRRERRATAVV